MVYRLSWLVLLFVMGVCPARPGSAIAQDRPPLPSQQHSEALQSPSALPTASLAPVDVSTMRTRGADPDDQQIVPYRYGKVLETSYRPSQDGTWEQLPSGKWLWRFQLRSQDAVSLSLAFTTFTLPQGASLYVYDPDHDLIRGPYTRDDATDGAHRTPLVRGERITIELVVPADRRSALDLTVGKVIHGYRPLSEGGSTAKAGTCNLDVACSQADPWRDQVRSVGRYTYEESGSAFVCSGALVNNTAETGRPLFLTAEHCVETPAIASTMVFYWNYQNPTCRTQGSFENGTVTDDDPTDQTSSGATLLARYGSAHDTGTITGKPDLALVEIDDAIPASYDLYLSGWNVGGSTTQEATTIHHPRGHGKRISFDEDPSRLIDYPSAGSCPITAPNGTTHLEIANWETGTTQKGSSGAPLFNMNQKIVGILSGGCAGCDGDDDAGDNNQADWYGRLAAGFNQADYQSRTFAEVLDPANTNNTTIAGRALNNLAPTISGVALSTRLPPRDTIRVDTGERIALRFTSNKSLDIGNAAISVSLDGPNTTDWKTFTDRDFSETDNGDGTFTYTLSTSATFSDGPGEYEASVDVAEDKAGNNGGNTGDGSGLSDAVFGVAVTVQAEAPRPNTPAELSLTIDDGGNDLFSVTRAVLRARKGGTEGGKKTYREEASESGSPFTSFSGTIVDTLATTRGIDYYVELSNSATTLMVGTPRYPRHLPVSFDQFSPPSPLAETLFPKETYQMVSVPALPNTGIKKTLRNAYGAYDPNQWRLERWSAGEDGYRAFPDLDALSPGDGFWLRTRQGKSFSLSEGRTVDADTLVTIPLTPGWNQIGTPFDLAVPWDTVQATSDLTAVDLDGPVGYEDGDFRTDRPALTPWRGYFVYNATGEPDTLSVPRVGQSRSSSSAELRSKTQSAAASGPRPSATASTQSVNSGRYTLHVEALSTNDSVRVDLGLWPEAKTGRDPYDHAHPPAPPNADGLRISALEPIDGQPVPHSRAIKPPGTNGIESGQSWTIRLRSLKETGAQTVKLRLRESGSPPPGYSYYLFDPEQNRRLTSGALLDLRMERDLKVIVGTEIYARLNSDGVPFSSLETTLRGNYPNPFARTTTVEYVLAEAQNVTIEVYNVLGQRVRTLVDDRKEAGMHQLRWDGTNRYGKRVGSGVYFLRLRAGDTSETRKAVLVR